MSKKNLDGSAESVAIRAEWKALSKMDTKSLGAVFQRSHRVCSLSGVPKRDLVSGIMYARHGERRIHLAFGLAQA
jgi:hypothetical protein